MCIRTDNKYILRRKDDSIPRNVSLRSRVLQSRTWKKAKYNEGKDDRLKNAKMMDLEIQR